MANALVPGGVLVASLLGSAHCVGMCGGLVIGFAKDGKRLAWYHTGRLLSYALLGAMAGGLGGAVFNAPHSEELAWIVSIVFGLTLIVLGVRRMSGRPLHFLLPAFVARIPARLIPRALAANGSSGVFFLGAMSALLPCGWLYTFVLAAAATKSAALGALSLSLFWLGTVPALTAAPVIFNRLTANIRAITPKLSGAMMIGLGLVSLGLHASPLVMKKAGLPGAPIRPAMQSCPFHHDSESE